MAERNIKTGLVGYFDILGHQDMLEEKAPEIIAEEIIPILTEIPAQIFDQLHTFIPSEDGKSNPMHAIVDSLESLIFSDTVLIALPVEYGKLNMILSAWTVFLMAASAVYRKLFQHGLPLRGVIEHGNYFIKGNCFAGRTIVDARRLSSKLELSACVLSEEASSLIGKLDKERHENGLGHLPAVRKRFFVEYLVPLKGDEKHMLTLNAKPYSMDNINIPIYVTEAFWANRNEISLALRNKAINTIKWLEFLEQKAS